MGKESFNASEVTGLSLQVIGGLLAIVELAELDLGGGLVGGMIFLLGSWIKNSSK